MAYCDDKCYLLEMVIGLRKSVSAAHKEFEHFRIYYAPRKCRCLQKLLTILVEKMPTVERLMKFTHSTTKRHVLPDAKSTLTCIEMLDPKDQTYLLEMVDDVGRLLENANEQLQRLVNSKAPEMTSNLENLIKMLQEKLPKVKQILDDTCKPLRLSYGQHKKDEDVLRYNKDGDTSSLKSEGKQSHLKSDQKMFPVKETHLSQGKNISKQQFELEQLYEGYDEIESSTKLLLHENMMLKDELEKEREHTAKIHELYKTKETMAFCTSKSVHQMKLLSESLSKENDLSASTMRQLKNVRKSSAESYGKGLYMEYWMQLKQSNSKGTLVPEFVKECFEICWIMAVQDPPMILDPEIHHDEDFNKNHYTAYIKRGSRIDYIVWPILLLHEKGPVLCKGVAAESH